MSNSREENTLEDVLLRNGNVSKLNVKYNTGCLNYCHYYEKQGRFKEKRYDKNNILEIGVKHEWGASSIKAWKEYFENSNIYGIDINPANAKVKLDRCRIFIGAQQDTNFLQRVVNETGNFDIIIDDGSHVNSDIIVSFEFLWDHLNRGGIYIIEDIHCTYANISKAYGKQQTVSRLQFEKWLMDKVLDMHHKSECMIEDICFIANGIIIRKRD